MHTRQIIAMGGGGFSMEPNNLLLDHYVLQHARNPNPVVCFVPTASGDAEDYIKRFYNSFSKLPCQPRHLSLFKPPVDLAAFATEIDIFYIGGGNTRNMLAIWRVCGFDMLLRRAWESGVVLAGLSAGAICWFQHGHTESTGTLGPIDCLGFLPGSCTPHYDGEPGRRPSLHALLQEGALPAGYALDDGAALHFIDDRLTHVVTSRPSARAFRVRCENGSVIEDPLPKRYLRSPAS